ncbi:DUF433 domain-containing protein [Hymenobacter psoromatis]|uniref:DUF433 domain-containing protein n=1 Tax=Hymenobacter psoromatis TaxID=1484116 RepID=UPI002FCDD880
MLSSPAHPLIGIDPEIRFGRPCIAGTRISVRDVLGWLGKGMDVAGILQDFPELTQQAIEAAQAYAADQPTDYTKTFGREPDFRVTYRLFTVEEGGRKTPAYQGIRWDFCYEDKTIVPGWRFMIYPEFLDPDGYVIPNGPFSPVGQANMFILMPERRDFHRQHIRPGVRGFFMDGLPAGVCEVTEVLSLR